MILDALGRMLETLEQHGVKAARQPRRARVGVSDYEAELRAIYAEWSDNLAAQLAHADADDRDRLTEAALALLLVRLQRVGRRRLQVAVEEALTETDADIDLPDDLLMDAIADNDQFLAASLIPALRERVANGLNDEDIVAALAADEGEAALGDLMDGAESRVALYAGAWWTLFHDAWGFVVGQRGSRVTAYLDPRAAHCNECPLYQSVAGEVYESMADYLSQTGDRVPGEFECLGNCRCWLTEA